MFVFVGLGNPGSQYTTTRHNVGFMLLDSLHTAFSFSPFKIKFSAFVAEGTIGKNKVILCKPQTFMNRSGISVAALLTFYKIPLSACYVAHDDIDLDLGRIKLKMGGGHGGHNGLKSLDQHMGKDYWRLRLGVGHPGHKDLVSDYVLSPFKGAERETVTDMLGRVLSQADQLLGADPGVWLKSIQQG